jgi:serine/threonine protein kinase/tetratricopeptide (TPR) repeat protein
VHAEAPTRSLWPADKNGCDDLAARLAEEMIRRWQAGERPGAEEFLERHPKLRENTEAALRIIYEEVCLRQEVGDPLPAAALFRRFPQWQEQLKKLLDCHQLLDVPAVPALPALTEELGDFVLLAELGRGAQGRVFLARQPRLGDRLVVLKVTPQTGHEHLTLARLQHTHIMPLYAVHDEPTRNLRTLCMPYLGGASLRQVLLELQDTPLVERTGQHLLDALDRASPRHEELTPLDAVAPIRQLFGRLSYVEAICWIGACLADGLQHAHERGLIHMDLKPSNVLLAADGQPLLLDFHIAQKPIQPAQKLEHALGGTPGYMSPEQWAAMNAVGHGAPIPAAVDAHTDLYSLGMLLQEALSGQLPLDGSAAPSLSDCNPRVSVGLADVIGKCQCSDPPGRYATAAELAADLRRHLLDLPLRGVRNRSIPERWRKWRRHQPYALALGAMAITVLAAALSLGLFAYGHVGQQRRDAESALAEGQDQIKKRAYGQAVATLVRGVALTNKVPGGSDRAEQMNGQLRLARRAQAAEQLHVLVERLRFLDGTSSLPACELSTLADRWRAVWDKRAWLKDRQGVEMEPEVEQRLDADLLDLGIIGADLYLRRSEPTEALQVLAETEAMFGTSHLVWRQREACAAALGQTEVAAAARRRAAELKPQTAWEYYALGRSLLQVSEWEQAAAALDKAIELEPQGFWPHFYQGVCAYRQKRFEDAAVAFRVCVALAPDCAECYYNRALARAALGRKDQAVSDYGRALQRDPNLSAAALNRGLIRFEQKRYAEALADLQHALSHGSDPALVHYNIALVHVEQHDRAAAIASAQRALQANADHQEAQALLKRLQRP